MKRLTDSKNKMLEIENHGDDILLIALEDLFSGKFDAPTVIKLRDIYRWIEKSTDNCYNVANTILNIVLKHG